MVASRFIRVALLSAACAAPLFAQDTDRPRRRREHDPSEFELRSSGSISFIQSRPTGAFQQNVGFGYGVNLAYMFGLDRRNILSLRADAGFAVYGDEQMSVPLSSTIGGRIRVNVNTNNAIVPLSIGPQLTWPTGPVRPYVHAGVGAQYFFTESSVEGNDDHWDFANTTNQSDWTGAWVGGGGVYLPVYNGKAKVLIDIGVQYFNGGRAKYLRPGSIEDLPNAQIRITPLESDTHMLLMRVGVKIGL